MVTAYQVLLTMRFSFGQVHHLTALLRARSFFLSDTTIQGQPFCRIYNQQGRRYILERDANAGVHLHSQEARSSFYPHQRPYMQLPRQWTFLQGISTYNHVRDKIIPFDVVCIEIKYIL